ncbi:MAG: 30S ribosomal protein S8 [Phycisphaerae bacterium]|nr:30S ribosomal protein S8 [Phycisphaerae bacterium]MBM92771.1 30S ribosomal protein S8 [Phycisphaerae bacterium]HCT43744.1 30S ribosomal protein S8 [Phycisphaerales bacterium]|tara:strand:- start:83 stop:481 length:399 start_codon:yes stop_codon:yes gene_type:complete
MSINDPVADMLTRIRNATRNRSKSVVVLNNKVCRGVAKTLQDEGYINGFEVVEDNKQGTIHVDLKYGPRGEVLIHEIKRMSKPGCRVYKKVDEIPAPMQGLGISVVSTSKGVLSGRQCRDEGVGGELLCTVL